jgi:hypothetical protein
MDGRLSRTARIVTRVHLLLCRDCRVHMDQLRTTLKVLHAVEPLPRLPHERKHAILEALRGRR